MTTGQISLTNGKKASSSVYKAELEVVIKFRSLDRRTGEEEVR